MWPIFLILGILLVITIIVCVYYAYKTSQFNKYCNEMIARYNQVELGMTKQQMFQLMGTVNPVAILKDGTEKYEWKIKINGTNTGARVNGVSYRKYNSGYMMTITIKVKNGYVVETKGKNLDNGHTDSSSITNFYQIQVGMTKSQVISLMGGGFSTSLLKNGDEKLEWKVREKGSSTRAYIAKGFSVGTTDSAFTRSAVVVFRDGYVVEKTSNNLDV